MSRFLTGTLGKQHQCGLFGGDCQETHLFLRGTWEHNKDLQMHGIKKEKKREEVVVVIAKKADPCEDNRPGGGGFMIRS